MNQNLTRRQWAGAVTAVATPAAQAQAPTPPQAPGTETPRQLLEQAQQSVRRNREQLVKVKLPIATEPSFQFRA